MLSEALAQCVHSPRIMCFDTALRTIHRARSLRHIEPFDQAQQQGLLLSRSQLSDGSIQCAHGFVQGNGLLRQAYCLADILLRVLGGTEYDVQEVRSCQIVLGNRVVGIEFDGLLKVLLGFRGA